MSVSESTNEHVRLKSNLRPVEMGSTCLPVVANENRQGIIMKETTFIIGGCRSGKSRYALELANATGGTHGKKKFFFATCVPFDDEMKQRVERHQRQRGSEWTTIEVPHQLPEAIDSQSRKANLILVDCLTLWISNLLLETDDPDKITDQTRRLTQSIKNAPCRVIIVSNEVGTGIVPENRLARQFRDAAGFANQALAVCADRVIWMVAGIPVSIK
jgi:adenosylcobinamide kinase/adenosylcobinamide-phosphate guanylyltransferase